MNALISTVAELEERLSRPTAGAVAAVRELPGDFVVLGVGGKIGPTLARMIRRALDQLGRRDRVVGVARFSTPGLPARLEQAGIEPVAGDLLDRAFVQRLPEAANVLFLAGQKFGTRTGPELTWAMNTYVPALCAERYARSRIMAFSTGCVYPLVPVTGGGAREEDPLGPPGDYANSCVGRERIFTYFARQNGTTVAICRLNYAIDLRYGVLLDVGRKVLRGERVDVTTGHANLIWQRDANAQAIQCLRHAANPPFVVNVTGPEPVSIRSVAQRFGELLGRPVQFTGQEAPTAWLADSTKARRLFGPPETSLEEMLECVAAWLQQGGPTLDQPTHFEVRDGQF
jgi:nucleoside-diphosphate-sugar epimerase